MALSALLSVLTAVALVGGFYYLTEWRLDALEARVEQLADIKATVSQVETHLHYVREDVRELRARMEK